VSGLAERLGLRRPPSRLDTTGTLRLPPEPVRVVSPEPPHHPEPLADEPFAPVYDYEQPGRPVRHWLPYPPAPDPIVFGVPLQAHEVYADDSASLYAAHGGCERCAVTWATTTRICWNCGT
jgi:hypothetical protein